MSFGLIEWGSKPCCNPDNSWQVCQRDFSAFSCPYRMAEHRARERRRHDEVSTQLAGERRLQEEQVRNACEVDRKRRQALLLLLSE